MMRNYIHPVFTPTDKTSYLNVVTKLRAIALECKDDVIYVGQDVYDILEDASPVKGKGHQVYGIEIKVHDNV